MFDLCGDALRVVEVWKEWTYRCKQVTEIVIFWRCRCNMQISITNCDHQESLVSLRSNDQPCERMKSYSIINHQDPCVSDSVTLIMMNPDHNHNQNLESTISHDQAVLINTNHHQINHRKPTIINHRHPSSSIIKPHQASLSVIIKHY